MIWWAEDPHRSSEERKALTELADRVSWLKILELRLDGVRLCWDVDIQTKERSYPFTLCYPDHFPHSPPLVLPRGVTERWSGHQYGAGGEFCLEFGPDNWHRTLTGADMLSSAYRLLIGEEAFQDGAEDVETRHRSSLGQTLRSHSNRTFIPFSAQALLSTLAVGASWAATAIPVFRKQRTALFLKSFGPEDARWEGDPPASLAEMTFDLSCRIVRMAETANMPKARDLTQFRAEWVQLGQDLEQIKVLLVLRGKEHVAFDLFVGAKAVKSIVLLEQEPRKRSADEMDMLAERRVSIIGCGSLGSKIANTLARSGVRRFVLVDDDVFLPENIVRNDLDWRDVGQHKVDAVTDRIGLIQPAAEVKAYKRSLGGQEATSDVEAVISALAETDLLIDATAESSAFNYLCAIQDFAAKPVLWGEVFGGGFGGLIARSRPGVDPDASTMRNRVLAWCHDHGRVIASSRGRYEGNGPEPEIASDGEVTVIAGHMSLMAIDALIPRCPSVYPYAAYLVGFRVEWIFEAPFDTRPIDVGQPLANVQASATEEERKAEVLKIVGLLESGT